jgi:succinate dehydrogenase / fumarate reductase, membrane anchor subunit
MKMSQSLKTPLGKVRGLGSAKSGTDHFWMQRLTAIANVPLAVAFVIILALTVGKPHAAQAATLANPIVAILVLLFVVAGVWHMRLGMQVVIEDYVPNEGRRIAFIVINTFVAAVVAVASIYAVFKISFGA